MRLSEYIVLLLFIAVIALVYAAAGFVIIAAIRRWARHERVQSSPFRKAMRVTVLVAAGVGIGCMAYGYFVEPYRLKTTHVKLTSTKLPGLSRPVRIVHISDLHCEAREHLEGALPGVIRKLNPDVIVFTGDALNSSRGAANFRMCMKRLVQIAPVLAVGGNLDIPWPPHTNLYEGTGVRLLEADAAEITLAPARLRFIGASPGRWHALQRVAEELDPNVFNVLLYHYPDVVDAAANKRIDLYLAGHTHGGQVALPGYGALVTLSKFGKTYEAGLYRVGRMWLYVNRGIGMEGGIAPRVRFCARPEVTLIEISPAETESQKPPTITSAPASR
jgi:hypothetical protein